MTNSLRKRSSGSSEGRHSSDPPDSHTEEGKDAGRGSGVALKKQIGLGSACGIIVGKWCFPDILTVPPTRSRQNFIQVLLNQLYYKV